MTQVNALLAKCTNIANGSLTITGVTLFADPDPTHIGWTNSYAQALSQIDAVGKVVLAADNHWVGGAPSGNAIPWDLYSDYIAGNGPNLSKIFASDGVTPATTGISEVPTLSAAIAIMGDSSQINYIGLASSAAPETIDYQTYSDPNFQKIEIGLPAGFLTVANVSASNAATVNGDGHVGGFTVSHAHLTDLDTSTLGGFYKLTSIALGVDQPKTLSYAEYVNANGKLITTGLTVTGVSISNAATTLGNPGVSYITIVDSSANIPDALDPLESLHNQITSITLTDSDPMTLFVRQLVNDPDAIALLPNTVINVSDTLANISSHATSLIALMKSGQLGAITLTDPQTTALSYSQIDVPSGTSDNQVTSTAYVTDVNALLSHISNLSPDGITISGVPVIHPLSGINYTDAWVLARITDVAKVVLTNTPTNANFSWPDYSWYSAAIMHKIYDNDGTTLAGTGIRNVDTLEHLSSLLANDPSIYGGFLSGTQFTDSYTNCAKLAQYLSSTSTPYKLIDTAAHIASNIDYLETHLTRFSTITVTDPGNLVSITNAQFAADQDVLSRLTNYKFVAYAPAPASYAAPDIGVLPMMLQGNANIVGKWTITTTVSGGTSDVSSTLQFKQDATGNNITFTPSMNSVLPGYTYTVTASGLDGSGKTINGSLSFTPGYTNPQSPGDPSYSSSLIIKGVTLTDTLPAPAAGTAYFVCGNYTAADVSLALQNNASLLAAANSGALVLVGMSDSSQAAGFNPAIPSVQINQFTLPITGLQADNHTPLAISAPTDTSVTVHVSTDGSTWYPIETIFLAAGVATNLNTPDFLSNLSSIKASDQYALQAKYYFTNQSDAPISGLKVSHIPMSGGLLVPSDAMSAANSPANAVTVYTGTVSQIIATASNPVPAGSLFIVADSISQIQLPSNAQAIYNLEASGVLLGAAITGSASSSYYYGDYGFQPIPFSNAGGYTPLAVNPSIVPNYIDTLAFTGSHIKHAVLAIQTNGSQAINVFVDDISKPANKLTGSGNGVIASTGSTTPVNGIVGISLPNLTNSSVFQGLAGLHTLIATNATIGIVPPGGGLPASFSNSQQIWIGAAADLPTSISDLVANTLYIIKDIPSNILALDLNQGNDASGVVNLLASEGLIAYSPSSGFSLYGVLETSKNDAPISNISAMSVYSSAYGMEEVLNGYSTLSLGASTYVRDTIGRLLSPYFASVEYSQSTALNPSSVLNVFGTSATLNLAFDVYTSSSHIEWLDSLSKLTSAANLSVMSNQFVSKYQLNGVFIEDTAAHYKDGNLFSSSALSGLVSFIKTNASSRVYVDIRDTVANAYDYVGNALGLTDFKSKITAALGSGISNKVGRIDVYDNVANIEAAAANGHLDTLKAVSFFSGATGTTNNPLVLRLHDTVANLNTFLINHQDAALWPIVGSIVIQDTAANLANEIPYPANGDWSSAVTYADNIWVQDSFANVQANAGYLFARTGTSGFHEVNKVLFTDIAGANTPLAIDSAYSSNGQLPTFDFSQARGFVGSISSTEKAITNGAELTIGDQYGHQVVIDVMTGSDPNKYDLYSVILPTTTTMTVTQLAAATNLDQYGLITIADTAANITSTIATLQTDLNAGVNISAIKVNETAPPAVWTKQFGVSASDNAGTVWGIANSIDGSGNLVVAGISGNTANWWGLPQHTFVTKTDASGNILWTDTFANQGVVGGALAGVATDHSGNIYLESVDSAGLSYLEKLSSSGAVLWQSAQSNLETDTASTQVYKSVAVDNLGYAYAIGDTTAGLSGLVNSGGIDGYLAKYDPVTGAILWQTLIGSTGKDLIRSVTTDSQGYVYVAGNTDGNLAATNGGGMDGFVVKYTSNGALVWKAQIPAAESDPWHNNSNAQVAVDSVGNVYITGTTSVSIGGVSYPGGIQCGYLAKLDANGNNLWVKEFGDNAEVHVAGLAFTPSGNITVVGDTYASLNGQPYQGGYADWFSIEYGINGDVHWTKEIGTSLIDGAESIAVNASGQVYIGGYSQGNFNGFTNQSGNGIGYVEQVLAPDSIQINASQFAQFSSVLSTIATSYSVTVSDSASNILANLNNLQAGINAGIHITNIAVTDFSPLTVLESQLITDSGALGLLTGNYSLSVTNVLAEHAASVISSNSNISSLAIVDTSAHIAANIDSLQTANSKIASITVSDPLSMSLTSLQIISDSSVLSKVVGLYDGSHGDLAVSLTANIFGTISANHFDSITGWCTGDTISFGNTPLSVVGNHGATVAGEASLANTGPAGLASFNGADTSLDQQIHAVEMAMHDGASGGAGHMAYWNNGGNTFILITGDASNAGNTISMHDHLIELVGVAANHIHLNNGSLIAQ